MLEIGRKGIEQQHTNLPLKFTVSEQRTNKDSNNGAWLALEPSAAVVVSGGRNSICRQQLSCLENKQLARRTDCVFVCVSKEVSPSLYFSFLFSRAY